MKNKTIKLVHGILVVPEDFIIVEESMTENSDHAGVLAERNGVLPHYVVLTDKPISELSDDEQEELYCRCEKAYPEIAALRATEITAIAENGKIKNAEEWLKSPRLGLFEIPEVEDEAHLYLHTGIIREG